MSGDEVFVTVAAIALGPVAWAWWLSRARSIGAVRPGRGPVPALAAAIGGAGLAIFLVLRTLAADDVREAPQYVVMYLALGLAWMRLAAMLFPLVGLNPRDDLIERRNDAAVPAWVGALFGVATCYAGGNVGNGPGWWVVVFSALLSTSALGAAWAIVGERTGLVEAVTVDRDPAAGVRLGGWLMACGLVCGSAVAGDWESVPLTVADFGSRIWPVLPIAVVVFAIERGVRPTPARPRAPIVAAGLLPALVYLALGAAGATWPMWARP